MTDSSRSDALAQALRLNTILHLVASRRQGRCIGRRQLAEACRCSDKTIQRDLALLRTVHCLDYNRSERTYYLSGEARTFAPVTLTRNDALALALARGLLTPSPAFPLAGDIEMVLDKATLGLPPDLRTLMEAVAAGIAERDGLARDYSQAPLRLLLLARAQQRTVEILYDSYSSGACERRRIDPYRLDRREGRYLTLQAWCHRHQMVRTFALNRILEARLTEATFTMQPWEESDVGVVGGLRGGEPVALVVRFDAVVAPFARDRQWPFEAVLEEQADGSVILRGEVLGMEGIVRELLSWRRHVEVLGGAELRARMAEEVKAMAALYEQPAQIV